METSSGKDAGSENFPVGSWLLPAHLRSHVFIYYDFARAADTVADTPDLTASEKIDRLDRFESVLDGDDPDTEPYASAAALRRSLAVTGISARHCTDLLKAFRQDATRDRYRDWADLIGYCRLSAAPVGRYMIDLHGGSQAGYGASDALCIALQILNHVQDCGDDFRTLNRIYLPTDWMAEAGVSDQDLAAGSCSPALRRVLEWTLAGVDSLLADSETLPATLVSTRLALEASVIIAIARRLRKKLATSDPLVEHVTLGGWQRIASAITGIASGIWARV